MGYTFHWTDDDRQDKPPNHIREIRTGIHRPGRASRPDAHSGFDRPVDYHDKHPSII